MLGVGTISRLAQVSFGRVSYGNTNFGFGGFSASVAQNNAHYLENQVVNAYDKVQQSANRANTANLGLAGSMADVASASNKIADANKLAKKCRRSQKALKELYDNFQSQMYEYDKIRWTSSTPFESELSKIGFEIEHTLGKFYMASKQMKADLIESAKQIDIVKANYELHGVYINATRQIELADTNGSKYKEMAFDLQDTANALHLAGQAQKMRF